ncbi:hypothetical protein [Taibaiella koreensis]|uniref:hypothetical protein n=1 Tax=Taibaiella koreensis TaxID=1268548 RepID=UPI000E59CE19|nr:hypothetical protein [Taibaiella koreensis]
MSGHYSFLPFLRQGLNTRITDDDASPGPTPGQRATFDLKITLATTSVGGAAGSTDTTKQFALKGPSDIISINSNAIVKVSPANWVTNFEPNYLPYIEFYDEDFCWRYTPAKEHNANTGPGYKYQLRPWITLVTLKDDEFELFTAPNGKPAFRTKKIAGTIFPVQSELWATAHVHVNDNIGASDTAPIGDNIGPAVTKLKGILNNDPDRAVSRLLSTRRLQPNTGYTVFLIPTYETGRRTGLGQDPFGAPVPDRLAGAWKSDTVAGAEFPIYHQWYFKTGAAGDFESLVRLLQPRILGADVGKRAVDLQKSNNQQLEAVAPPTPVINLQGVVKPVNAVSDNWNTTDTNLYAKKIRDIINEPTEILNAGAYGDPIIAPPIYGRWHAAKDKVDAVSGTPDWLQEANLDPRYRLFAGAGVETVRRNQEQYMDIAWAQIGEVLEANRKLRQLQISRQANLALYNKHLKSLNQELLVNISAPIHQRIRNNPETATVYKDVDNSAIPVTMLSGAFRRLTRPGGPLVTGIALTTNTQVTTTELISGVNNGTVLPATAYQAPLGQTNYSVWNASQLTPSFTLSLQPNAGFQFANPGIISSTPVPGPNAPATQVMVNAIASLHGVLQSLPQYSFQVNSGLDMNAAVNIILKRTEPYNNAVGIAKSTIKLSAVDGNPVNVPDTNFIMAAPRIKTPMYAELAALSPDWIMPGLNDIEMNSINILKTDQKYIEAYMLGLNYEMGRELLWRGYPTDQRGTCFSFFWGYNSSVTNLVAVDQKQVVFDLERYRDIEDIHQWRSPAGNPTAPLTQLGANNARKDMTEATGLLILTIRGELLRKYPGTMIYLQQAAWKTGVPNPQNEPRVPVANTEVLPIFTGHVEPDIYLLGFPKDAATIRGKGLDDLTKPGYFVVFQERVGEIRFGADEASAPITGGIPNIADWNHLSWAEIKADPAGEGFVETARNFDANDNPDLIKWNWNGATIAYALQQSPVKLNVHAQGLIPA